ncbi:MAG: hypothetical protein LBT40_01275 [Deltaproteobacteria bacterium]|nr:hypothetical protein [Deltaproteobacteria bacterium]
MPGGFRACERKGGTAGTPRVPGEPSPGAAGAAAVLQGRAPAGTLP